MKNYEELNGIHGELRDFSSSNLGYHDKCILTTMKMYVVCFIYIKLFSYFVQANVTAIQYNFSKLVGKLENLKSDLNLTKIPEMQGL